MRFLKRKIHKKTAVAAIRATASTAYNLKMVSFSSDINSGATFCNKKENKKDTLTQLILRMYTGCF